VREKKRLGLIRRERDVEACAAAFAAVGRELGVVR